MHYTFTLSLAIVTFSQFFTTKATTDPHREEKTQRQKIRKQNHPKKNLKPLWISIIILLTAGVIYTTCLKQPSPPPSSAPNIEETPKKTVKINNIDIQVIESQYNQYSLGSTGSCTINALEMGLQLLLGKPINKALLDHVVTLAAHYKSSQHTSIEDILPEITRYSNLIELLPLQQNLPDAPPFQTYQKQSNVQHMKQDIQAIIQKHGYTLPIVITKPPESIFIYILDQNTIYLFDSHPRPEKGITHSHLLIFKSKSTHNALDTLVAYMQTLFPHMEELGKQYNQIAYTSFKLKEDAKERVKALDDQEQLIAEFKQLATKLEKK